MAGAVEALARELEPLTPLAAIQRVWREVAGPAIAAECTPVAERGGTVTVACSSAVWAQELSLMAPELVQRLAAALDGVTVSELRCRVASRHVPGAPASPPPDAAASPDGLW